MVVLAEYTWVRAHVIRSCATVTRGLIVHVSCAVRVCLFDGLPFLWVVGPGGSTVTVLLLGGSMNVQSSGRCRISV